MLLEVIFMIGHSTNLSVPIIIRRQIHAYYYFLYIHYIFSGFYFIFFLKSVLLYYYQQEWSAWGGRCTGLRAGLNVCSTRWWSGSRRERRWVWRPGPGVPRTGLWEWVAMIKEFWHAAAMVPSRSRNPWKSSCPSQFRFHFSIAWSRTPGSFWLFVKAASFIFMTLWNSLFERLWLFPSLPGYFWKAAIRDSGYLSVSVELMIFALLELNQRLGLGSGSKSPEKPQTFLFY